MGILDEVLGNKTAEAKVEEETAETVEKERFPEEKMITPTQEEAEFSTEGTEINMDNKLPQDNRLDGISDKNEVKASGVIVHKFETPSRTMLTLKVMGGRKLDVSNFPEFVCYRDVKEAAKDYKPGDHVQIAGHLATFYNKKTEEYTDGVVAESIERTPTRLSRLTLEAGLGRQRDFPMAEFYFAGSIQRFEVTDNCLSLNMKTQEEGKKAVYFNCRMYYRDLESIAKYLKKGKKYRICAVGEIQTKKIEEEGKKPRYLQYNVISDISSIEEILSIKR